MIDFYKQHITEFELNQHYFCPWIHQSHPISYSFRQSTHPAKTNLCRNSPKKGARNIGSAQAQELIGGNDLVTCLLSEAPRKKNLQREIPKSEILVLSESFRLWNGCREKQPTEQTPNLLKTRKQKPHIAAVRTLPVQMEIP